MTAETRTHIRSEIDKHVRVSIHNRRGPKAMETHEGRVAEVNEAIAEFRRSGPWPPNVHVPKAVLSALIGA